MMRLHLSKRGQATFPKRLREWLGVQPGDDISVRLVDGKVVLQPPTPVAGMLAKYSRLPAEDSPSEEEQAIGQYFAALDEKTKSPVGRAPNIKHRQAS